MNLTNVESSIIVAVQARHIFKRNAHKFFHALGFDRKLENKFGLNTL